MKRLGGVAVLLLIVLVSTSSASAAEVVEVGWWTRSPAASAPEGGIAVSNAPDGPVSVGAVRIDLGTSGVSSATLTLPQSGGAAPAGAQLVVCVVDAPWKATAAGAMAEAPATSCAGTSANLTLDGTSWTADVQDLVGERTGPLAFAVVPSAGSTGVWELQFDKPAFQGTAASTPTTRPTATTAPRTTPTTAFASAPRPTPAFTPPPPPAVTTTTVAITPTTVNNFVPNVAPSSEVAFGGATSSGDESSEGRPIGQAVGFVVLATAIGVAGGAAHKLIANRQLAS